MNKIKIRSLILAFIALLIVIFLLFLKSVSAYVQNPFYTALSLFVVYFIGLRVGASFFYHPLKFEGDVDWPSVTFIIPTYNEEELINETIDHCFEADYPTELLEVVVINDGSSDNTWKNIKIAKKKHPQLVTINFEKNKGKREAMAAGMRKAKGDIITQIDSDSFIEKNSLKNLVYSLHDKKMGAVSAHTDPANKNVNLLTRIQAAYYFLAFRVMKGAEAAIGLVFCCSGCCSAFRKEVVLPLLDEWTSERHFGERMNYGEDRALTNLIIRSGFNTTYCSSAQAYTEVPTRFKKFIIQQVRWKKSWIITTQRTALYIFKRDYFAAILFLFPQIILVFFIPILVINAVILAPIILRNPPFVYFIGLFAFYALLIIYYSYLRPDEYRPYLILWGILNIFLSTVVFPYALFSLKNNRWGTR